MAWLFSGSHANIKVNMTKKDKALKLYRELIAWARVKYPLLIKTKLDKAQK